MTYYRPRTPLRTPCLVWAGGYPLVPSPHCVVCAYVCIPISTHVRSMREGNVFSLFVHQGAGGVILGLWYQVSSGGTPGLWPQALARGEPPPPVLSLVLSKVLSQVLPGVGVPPSLVTGPAPGPAQRERGT